VAPADAPRGGIDLLEEFVLSVEIELDIRERDLLAREIALHGGDRYQRPVASGVPGSCRAGAAANSARSLRRSVPATGTARTPALLQAMPQVPHAVSKMK